MLQSEAGEDAHFKSLDSTIELVIADLRVNVGQ